MIPLNIRFHPSRDDLIFPDIEEGQGVEAGLVELVIVADGVSNPNGDRPSVVLKLDLPEGRVGVALTTARLFVTVARMIEAKYPDLMKEPD